MSDYVNYEQQGDIAILSMDDGKANAYGLNMIKALSEALQRAESEAKVTVIRGRTGLFSAGFDLKVMAQGADAQREMVTKGAETILDIFTHPQPVIIAATGHALAAGALLLLTGDHRIGLNGNFKIGLNETAIGMAMPQFGIEMARNRLGEANLTQAVLNAQLYSPTEAVELGYLDQAVDQDRFDAAIQSKAESLLALDGKAFAATKARLRKELAKAIRATL